MKYKYQRMALLIIATMAIAACLPCIALATVGVGTTTPRIVIDQSVRPGGIYRLPVIPVINTGSERSEYTVFVDAASKQTEFFVDPRWIQVTPTRVSIEASQNAEISATMYVPLMARPGEYQTLIVAQPVVPGAAAGTPNVQVGTKIVFQVEQSNFLVALFWRILSLLELWAPWSYASLALLVVVPTAWYVTRRYRFSFAVSRRL